MIQALVLKDEPHLCYYRHPDNLVQKISLLTMGSQSPGFSYTFDICGYGNHRLIMYNHFK